LKNLRVLDIIWVVDNLMLSNLNYCIYAGLDIRLQKSAEFKLCLCAWMVSKRWLDTTEIGPGIY